VGKSTLIKEKLPQDITVISSDEPKLDVELIKKWLLTPAAEKPILFIDEANLLPEGVLEIFEGLYGEPKGVTLAGKFYPVSDAHKVVFAGNFSHYENRVKHDFISRHGNVIEIPPLIDDELRQDVMSPVLQSLKMDKDAENIQSIFLKVYHKVNQDNPDLALTPRNVMNMIYRLHYFTQGGYQNAFKKIEDAAWFSAYEEIRYLVKPVLRKTIKAEMKSVLAGDYKNYKAVLAEKSHHKHPLDSYSDTYAHRTTNRIIRDHLEIREHLLADNQLKSPMQGLLVEGAPGAGKTSMVENHLRDMGYRLITDSDASDKIYYNLSANLTKAIEQLMTAFRTGGVVIINEINTLTHLEPILNAMMSGKFMGQYAHPGFLVIGTQNPISFNFREKLSPAFQNRFLVINTKDYVKNDFLLIADKKKLSKSEAEPVRDLFNEFDKLKDVKEKSVGKKM